MTHTARRIVVHWFVVCVAIAVEASRRLQLCQRCSALSGRCCCFDFEQVRVLTNTDNVFSFLAAGSRISIMTTISRQRNKCAVLGCVDLYSMRHRFPRNSDEIVIEKWVIACGNPLTSKLTKEEIFRLFICDHHFSQDSKCPELKRGLKRTAVPSLFLPEIQNSSQESDLNEVSAKRKSDEALADSVTIDHDYIAAVVPRESQDSDPQQIHLLDADANEDANELDLFIDSSTIDHDYIATKIPRKSQASAYIKTKYFCEDNHEDLLAKQHTLENLRRELCRLCAQKGAVLMPIFEPVSETAKNVPISSKIDMYLPIKVTLEDSLPFCICSNCLSVLNHWHELYTTCVAADAVLSKTFAKECSATTINNPCTSEVQRNAETQTEEMPSDPVADEIPLDPVADEMHLDPIAEEMKETEDICTHCGESKTGIIQEDKLFKEEFDKSFHTYRNTWYKCRFCYELFKNSSDRKSHIAICRQLSTICELCGHKVACRKNLKRHKYEKHVVVPPKYLCDKCDKFFKSAKGLCYHLRIIHSTEDQSRKYCCELCGSVFKREDYYRVHKRKHEKGMIQAVFEIENFRQKVNSVGSENHVVYACPVCQKKFHDTLSLAVHVTEKKKLKCSSCLKLVWCEKRLYLHVCGQWTCQYCLKSFDQRIKWMVHERLHTGEKPIKCRKCDLTFRTWQSRRRHELLHEPSFRCIYCEKSFRNKDVFKDHVSCHEGMEFPCHICNKKFSGRKNLGKHLRAYHKDLGKTVCNTE